MNSGQKLDYQSLCNVYVVFTDQFAWMVMKVGKLDYQAKLTMSRSEFFGHRLPSFADCTRHSSSFCWSYTIGIPPLVSLGEPAHHS
ncbi:hypothetical protein V6N12_013387 [Hibiscus sabdariffa]|uniref:Uncharacterized protein n=1 Tax=Hibiscus sabdariffa TaxID=183260 RepID=A0ABR2D950_9ROSI